MSAPPLARQTILITGAAHGLGAALARGFAGHGARLALIDVDGAALAGLARGLSTETMVETADLSDAEQTIRAADRILDAGWHPDTLIHNAGVLHPAPIVETTLATFRATLDVCVQAGFLLAQAFWPRMVTDGGAMIFVSSNSGVAGFAGETAYCAAKHGIEGLSKALAEESQGRAISCTITPGVPIRTPMSERIHPSEMRAQWIEPDRLFPAFAEIARTRDRAFSGTRVNAWGLISRPVADGGSEEARS